MIYSRKAADILDVLFKRCNREVDCVLLLAGDIATPLKESQVFSLRDLVSSHVFIPGRPTWNLQVLVVAASLDVLLRRSSTFNKIVDKS